MSNQANKNNGKCKTDLVHDIAGLPDGVAPKGAFEAVFLGNMLAHIDGECMNDKKIIIKQQCKTQLPDIHSKNWCKWLTAVDQENQISLTHTIERANVPILYNTPRLCDPGITMSKNWSLRNYIESRLYMFKFVYDFGRGYTQTSNGSGSKCGNNTLKNTGNNRGSSCYPTAVFDFRPYTFALKLPTATNNGRLIYVTQHITVDADSGALGFTPHTSLTTYPYTPVKNTETSKVVFKSLVKSVIDGKALGSNQKSVLNSNYNLGNNGTRVNNQGKYIDTFIDFLRKYDRIKFAGEGGLLPNSKLNSNQVQKVTLTDSVIRTMFYDLIHDEVINKTDSFEEFRDNFIKEFNNLDFGFKPTTGGAPNKVGRQGIVKYSKLIGKTVAGKSYKAYKSILTPSRVNGLRNHKTHKVKRKNGMVNAAIPQYPALFKTIGDLSQFMYAAKFNTIVGSGDKMGIATGLYVNALNGKIVKCMIEDAVTGFIIYTGMDPNHVKFITKSGCGGLANKANTCYGRNGATISVTNLQSQMINGLNANEKSHVNGIRNRQKTYLNRLKTNLRKNNVNQLRQQGASPAAAAKQRAEGGATNRNQRANKLTRARNLNAYINNLQRQLSNRGKLNKLNKSRYLSELSQNSTIDSLLNIKKKVKANAQRILRQPTTNNNQQGVKRLRTN